MNEQGPANTNAAVPPTLDHILGQQQSVQKLKIAVESAFARGLPLPSVLLTGPAGVGKSMIARILAAELGTEYTEVLGQTLASIAALHGVLIGATPKAIVFIDEIHELSPACQIALLKVLDEGAIFLCNGQSNKVTRLQIADCTIVAATTNPEAILRPLLDRFKVVCQLQRYDSQDLVKILRQKARHLSWTVDETVFAEIANRSFGTPRLALRLLESTYRTATARGLAAITEAALQETLAVEGLDSLGLDADQQRYLNVLAEAQGPVRINVLASKLRLDPATVSRSIEDKLLDCDLIERGNQGRMLTVKGWEHIRRTWH